MSGLEILGAVSAVSGLLEAAIGIVGRIREAHERQKDLITVLDHHNSELTDTNVIVQLVKNEEALQTAAVAAALVNINAIGTKLVAFLQNLDPGEKSKARQFLHQLSSGSKDEKILADTMKELAKAKTNLSLCIQVANVGLTRSVNDTLVANAEVVRRINDLIQEVLGEGRGLKIAQLIENRPAKDGVVPLSDTDIASLSNAVPSSIGSLSPALGFPVGPSSRVVLGNTTKEQALQMNGPIGEKGWWEVSHLEIKNNDATGQSIQVNHAVSEEIFDRLMNARDAGLAKLGLKE